MTMNKLYADKGVPVDNTKQDMAIKAVNKIIERDKQSMKRSTQILDYYKNRQQNGMRI